MWKTWWGALCQRERFWTTNVATGQQHHAFRVMRCDKRDCRSSGTLCGVDCLLGTDLSRQAICTIFQGQTVWTAWHLKMGSVGCPETSVTKKLRCVTYQKSEEFIYTVVEAVSYTQAVIKCKLKRFSSVSWILRHLTVFFCFTNSYIFNSFLLFHEVRHLTVFFCFMNR